MAGPKYPGLDTLALHAGAQPDPATGASAPNIVMSTTFVVDDPDVASTSGVELDTHRGCSSIEGVLDQFLHNRRRPLDDFSGGDLVDEVIRKRLDRHPRSLRRGSGAGKNGVRFNE